MAATAVNTVTNGLIKHADFLTPGGGGGGGESSPDSNKLSFKAVTLNSQLPAAPLNRTAHKSKDGFHHFGDGECENTLPVSASTLNEKPPQSQFTLFYTVKRKRALCFWQGR